MPQRCERAPAPVLLLLRGSCSARARVPAHFLCFAQAVCTQPPRGRAGCFSG